MLRRSTTNTRNGERTSPVRKPSSSGPRWRIAAVITRTRDSASALRETKATPHMPHTLFFYLRRGNERAAGPQRVLAQLEPWDSQTPVSIPGKRCPQHQEKQCPRGAQHEIQERLALQHQAPVHRFFPSRIDRVQQRPQMKSVEREPRQPHVSEMFERVLARIIRDGARGLGEYRGILQVLARQRAALSIPQNGAVGWIDYDPAVAD